MNLTVAEAREQIALAANLCSDDTRVISYLNRAVRRLLSKGKWVGTYARVRICASDNTITWPRKVQTLEAVAISKIPTKVRNEWFEFLETGLGIRQGSDTNGLQLLDRGEVVIFNDITENSSGYVRVYCDVTESSGKYITLLGNDENGNRVRTQVSGTWIDGERIAIPTVVGTPTVSTKRFTTIEKVIKSATNGVIRLYEYNGTSNVQALAYYDPDETLPTYRRSYIPALENVHSDLNNCDDASIEAMAKLRFYKVANENDFLLIGNVEALEAEVRALQHFDNKNFEEGYKNEAYAVKLLNEELESYQGSGAVLQMRVENGDTFGAGNVENCI